MIKVNEPDKIIFVGEALVGNEAVDQLQQFNKAIKEHSGTGSKRHIDGLILTKFDTIDDKVINIHLSFDLRWVPRYQWRILPDNRFISLGLGKLLLI